MSRSIFRLPEKTTEAVQFTGDWNQLVEDLGWTPEQLMERWPRIPEDDTTMVFGWPGEPHKAFVGWWLILDGDHITGFASELACENWGERVQ